MSADKPYAELVAQAEQAVSGVQDAELRRVAFERVLDNLLVGEHPSATSQATSAARDETRARGPSTSPDSRPRNRPRVRQAQPKGGGPQAHIEELVAEKFFGKPKTISEVKAELENRGHHIALTSLSGPLQKLCQKKMLRRQKVDSGTKKTYAYSNW